uniref:Uncharacterized protein n=1 Tax=Oryza rufipogon TaxID=4529 RepID=A0A0E0QPE8_ORYRU
MLFKLLKNVFCVKTSNVKVALKYQINLFFNPPEFIALVSHRGVQANSVAEWGIDIA